MYLLVGVVAFLVGTVAGKTWFTWREGYWYRKARNLLKQAESMQALIGQLRVVAERVETYERGQAVHKMRIGLTRAIASMGTNNGN